MSAVGFLSPRKYNGLPRKVISAYIKAGKRNMNTEEMDCTSFITDMIFGCDQSIRPSSATGMPNASMITAIRSEPKIKAAPNRPRKIASWDRGDLTRK